MSGAHGGVPCVHDPVLRDEVIRLFSQIPGGLIVDGTVGLGGHAEALLDTDPCIRVIGIDRDEEALVHAVCRLARFGDRVRLIHGNYADIGRHLDEAGASTLAGCLLDVGASSLQFDDPARGFSFRTEGPLDMRMDQSKEPTAAEWIAEAGEDEIVDALFRYGEERYARRIARAIVAARSGDGIASTVDLARIVRRAIPGGHRWQRIDPATRSFQALRIVVNKELENLSQGLDEAFDRLAPGGILVAISFHSLEDRIVKTFFRHREASCVCPPDLPMCVCDKRVDAEILTRKPIMASKTEIERNPRARSAKLRAARKVV